MISKEEWEKWEAEVFDAFYDSNARLVTDITPTNGSPTVACRRKIMLVPVEFSDGQLMTERVKARESVPSVRTIKLHHVSGHKPGVKYGLEAADHRDANIFKYPALDTAGNSNLRQTLGEDPAGELVFQPEDTNIFEHWKRLVPNLDPSFESHIEKWITDVQKEIPRSVIYQLYSLRPEHRTLVTMADVRDRTGAYYIRVYGKGDKEYATESDGETIYCAIFLSNPDNRRVLNTNITQQNISDEYFAYGEGESPCGSSTSSKPPSLLLVLVAIFIGVVGVALVYVARHLPPLLVFSIVLLVSAVILFVFLRRRSLTRHPVSCL